MSSDIPVITMCRLSRRKPLANLVCLPECQVCEHHATPNRAEVSASVSVCQRLSGSEFFKEITFHKIYFTSVNTGRKSREGIACPGKGGLTAEKFHPKVKSLCRHPNS